MKIRITFALGLLLTLSTPIASGASPSESVMTPQRIEDDWLLQDTVRQPIAMTTQRDAAGGCDGIKDVTYGFHTSRDKNPWWQVDLGESLPLNHVVIYNRCDRTAANRAERLLALLSDDGRNWTEFYRHDGTTFFGQPDGKPLVIPVDGAKARFVRVQLSVAEYFHLDEVEVYQTGNQANLALGKPADQSSVSKWWSARAEETGYRTTEAVQSGLELVDDLRHRGADVEAEAGTLRQVADALSSLSPDASEEIRRSLYFQARHATRRVAMKNPLLDFDDLLLVKRAPGSFTHMSDQYYGWYSRPGGGLYILEDFKTDTPNLLCLTDQMAPGSILRPDISYNGRRVLFAHCKHYPGLKDEPNKLDKANVPEDAFYHLYEMNLDGSGLRQLTYGKYDDFDGRYLPDGRIVFLSTRRGRHIQCGKETACIDGSSPDVYVRCGGGPERPVAVYTLHVMGLDGRNIEQISPFEMFEWTPSIDHDGRILYSRWDYIDRHNMPYMSLWSTMPDGTAPLAVFGNYTRNPHCFFEARSIPGSRKIIFTASAHHAMTGGSLVLLDPQRGTDGLAPMTRLTPEVCFPESEGWPSTYFVNPYPLAEEHYLTAWSDSPLPSGVPQPPERPAWAMPGPTNDLGVYLFDTFGNMNLIYRDPAISSMYPLPIRPRRRPPTIGSLVKIDGPQEAEMLLQDVYQGLETIPRGTIRRLRLVGVPPKTHPTMNNPAIGVTRDDPGKFVMGTVPVEKDGSAYFRAPSGVTFFLQALDEQGMAVQTMRSATYLQPGERRSCIGCHEHRQTAPPNVATAAARRDPSKITPGPEGTWPLDFRVLVQPVLKNRCVGCHKSGGKDPQFDLTASHSYDSLLDYGKPSLRQHIQTRYHEGRSSPGECASRMNPLWELLGSGHYDVKLTQDDRRRLIVWMDTYGQRLGSFDQGQEEQLRQLWQKMAAILED